jgi:hypothetical protein
VPTRPSPRVAVDVLVAHLVARIDGRSLARAKAQVPPRQRSTIERALKTKGYEVTARFFRRPLVDQVREALREGPIVLARLQRKLSGAESAQEVHRAITAAGAQLVLVKGKPTVVGREVEVLTGAQVKALTKLLAPALKGPKPLASVRLGDVTEILWEATSRVAPAKAESTVDAEALVVTTIARLAGDEQLVLVPRVVRELGGRLTPAQVSEALLAATERGRLELRPDSGIELLSAEDAALCPRSPSGMPLSYVVPLRGGS